MIILWIGLFLGTMLVIKLILAKLAKRSFKKELIKEQLNNAKERRALEDALGVERMKLLEEEDDYEW